MFRAGLRSISWMTSSTWMGGPRKAFSSPSSSVRLFRPQTRIPSPSQTQQRYYRYGRQFNANRFRASQNIFYRWAARPTFYYEAAGLGGTFAGFYLYNVEEVPVTGRRRFNIISESFMNEQSQQMYQQTLQEYRGHLLPPNHPVHRTCQRVLDRLIPHSGLSPEHTTWELNVIADDNLVNAFVIPGGKVFVGTGMLRVCPDDDSLAAVLSHEIAHNVAQHSAERLSQYGIFLPVALIGTALLGLGDFTSITRLVLDLVIMRPGSRRQESEADHIGVLMMAEACFDPAAAVGLWERMDQMDHGAPPQILSTHPSNGNRREAILGWLDAARAKRDASGCGPTAGWAGDFYRSSDRWS